MSRTRSEAASITAQNTFTAAMNIAEGELAAIAIWDAFAATVTLQSSLDGGTTWIDVDSGSWTAPIRTSFLADVDQKIRIGVKTGDFTSGTCQCSVSTSS